MSTVGAFVLTLFVLAVIVGSYYYFLVPAPPEEIFRAQDGDRVTVDYIGHFEDTGLVFDTSNESVARDNASWPKAVSFSGGPAGGVWRVRWQPLQFTLGEGSLVEGFEDGIQGLTDGDRRTLVIPPEFAYGAMDLKLIFEKPLLEPVPVRVTMNTSDFQVKYGASPTSGMNVTDPFWGWNAIVSVAGSVITVTNSPALREIVRPFDAWDARVEAIDDAANEGVGIIWVRHLLMEAMEHRVGGMDQGDPFYLSDVDPEAGTYTLNYNREVVGRTLVFIVRVLSVIRT